MDFPEHFWCRCALVSDDWTNSIGTSESLTIDKVRATFESVKNSNPDGTWKPGTKRHMRLVVDNERMPSTQNELQAKV